MENSNITVIKSKNKLLGINLKELFGYKDLIFLFVKRNFISSYKQTILGPLWALIQPLLTTFIFSFVFGTIAGLSTGGVPHFLFYLCANILWTYFSHSLSSISNMFISNSHLFGKVYFPRLVIPISTLFTNLISFLIQTVFFILSAVFFSIFGSYCLPLTPWLFFIPLLVLMLAIFSLGLGLIFCSITAKYRDLLMLITFGIQLWMYASPIAYDISTISTNLLPYYMLNPISPIVAMLRYSLFGNISGNISVSFILQYLCVASIIIFIILFIGIILFNKVEKTFMDVV